MTLTFAGLVLVAAVGSDPAPTPASADDLRLVVPSGRTGPADLFLVDPVTGNAKNLTRTEADEELFPAWSPDGKKLAFCCRNKDHGFEVFVCDADGSNRKQLSTPPGGPLTICTSPTWSPDGAKIAYARLAAGERGEIRVVGIDGADDERIAADGLFPTWSPDGKRIAFVQTGGDGKPNRLVSANPDGSDVKVLVAALGRNSPCMPAWSPDGLLIAYSAETPYGWQLCVIPAAGGTPRQLTCLLGLNLNPVWIGPDRLLFSHFAIASPGQPGGAYATIKADGTRLDIHPLTRSEPAHPLIRPAAFVPPQPAAETNPVRQAGFAEPVEAKPLFSVMPEVIHAPLGPGGAAGLAWSADGKQLAVGIDAGVVALADFDGKSLRPAEALRGHEGRIEAVAFSADGKRLFSAGFDKSVRVWDLTLKGTKAIETDHAAAVGAVCVSPGGEMIVTGGAEGQIKVRAADTGKPVREFPLAVKKLAVASLAFGKDGVLFAGGGRWELPVTGGVVAAFDPQTGKETWRTSEKFGGVWALAVSPDGEKLAGACLDCCVRIWDTKTGKELGCWQGHADRVTGVCWSPDGKAVVSCGFDHTVRVWDAASGGLMHTLAAHAGPVLRVAFSPTG
ncbi:MAG TPA: hypothetical protein VKE74_06970, partial [Gemmataceae bacterium]|nr:hypothetical protein [Gemmataceae bacterium]